MIRIRFKAFVDESAGLLSRVAEANRQALLKVGEAIQKQARSLIRTGRGPSLPGQPPISRTGKLPDSIQVELDGDTVLIGPTAHRSNPRGGTPTVGPVPANLEGGGQILITEVFRRGRWEIAKGPTGNLRTRKRVVTVEPRPYMGPALNEIGPRLPSYWEDTL